ncbi:MAG TPA: arsenate reductase ArsC [Persephonella sp.]|uniref:Protein ArsC (Arsenate reductase) (Arsenical pumpmodifier) (Low molecular weight protein-tyrosine-phosphatase) n=1 Tax=Persephonella marina (strain DSM 14350 / EX-H1) TaxID=123214 RepID=C0QPK0_PERMH|nr:MULTISPECIES: arsenate reductase ArsC [Persephonella]ACO03141.1 protein ArsC (Arsenate reductase) (Arsenical pumpmodifier) (Low molecular weight protein-tyrosine-phosphatase) [Persephonella marina EX-H1]HCB69789.1 arsenate reductase ArsC [Persephonella sp.]
METKIAFICTGNSARSQMAEGFCKYYAEISGKDIAVYSAGSSPSGYIHPLSVKVMLEKGIDISGQRSKSLDDIPLNKIDYLITLCSDAEKNCPVVSCKNVFHWNLPDPAEASGTEEERLVIFRNVRDIIENKILDLLKII